MEKTIDIIPNVRKTKWLGLIQKPYCIIVTDQSTIFAKIDNKKLNEHLKKAREEAGTQGAGFFGRMKAQMYATRNYSERYQSMSAESIRAESAENQTIPHEQIQKIKVRYIDKIEDEDSYDYRNQSTIVYKTNTEKIKFNTQGDWRKKIKQIYEGKAKVV